MARNNPGNRDRAITLLKSPLSAFVQSTSEIFIALRVAREQSGLELMNGFNPQQSTCPQCGIQRTVRAGGSGISVCMNCRAQWTAGPAIEREHTYPFTPAELNRLEIYRRAIAAGFYND
jgi:ribosomal protein L37AE/L43A